VAEVYPFNVMHQLSVGHGESAQVHLNVFKPLPGIGHFDFVYNSNCKNCVIEWWIKMW